MKMLIVNLYEAVPVYDMFPDCYYTHIDDLVYFVIPESLYIEYVKILPAHIINDCPLNLSTLSNKIINLNI